MESHRNCQTVRRKGFRIIKVSFTFTCAHGQERYEDLAFSSLQENPKPFGAQTRETLSHIRMRDFWQQMQPTHIDLLFTEERTTLSNHRQSNIHKTVP